MNYFHIILYLCENKCENDKHALMVNKIKKKIKELIQDMELVFWFCETVCV